MSGWLDVGRYSVFPWSISGVETCVVVKSEGLHLTFDVGYACRESISSKFVLLSHGHMDHISGLPHHVMKKSLYSMKPAKYYVPEHLLGDLRSVCQLYARMAGGATELENIDLNPAPIHQPIQLSSSFLVKPFPTPHRVPSQGYVLYHTQKKLKEEHKGKTPEEISGLVKEGVEITHISQQPEIAYTGDTTFDLFLNSPPEDLFKVKLLITEATYIDQDRESIQKARDRGHMHLQELVDNASLFESVDKILLIHFSDKYSVKYVKDIVQKTLPPSLSEKVLVSTIAKEKHHSKIDVTGLLQ